MKRVLSWKISGLILGLTFFIVLLFAQPIGVSTQFVVLDGIVWDKINPSLISKNHKAKLGYKSSNAYLNKSGGKYAKSVKNPINYDFIFVLAMFLGGIIAKLTIGSVGSPNNLCYPKIWVDNFGQSKLTRFVATFIGGVLVLYGARLAGGCTSGHMMSGMMQTAVSGYLFALGAFISAIPLALIMYRK